MVAKQRITEKTEPWGRILLSELEGFWFKSPLTLGLNIITKYDFCLLTIGLKTLMNIFCTVTIRFNTDVYEMFCVIWYHLYNLKKKAKNTHGGVSLFHGC